MPISGGQKLRLNPNLSLQGKPKIDTPTPLPHHSFFFIKGDEEAFEVGSAVSDLSLDSVDKNNLSETVVDRVRRRESLDPSKQLENERLFAASKLAPGSNTHSYDSEVHTSESSMSLLAEAPITSDMEISSTDGVSSTTSSLPSSATSSAATSPAFPNEIPLNFIMHEDSRGLSPLAREMDLTLEEATKTEVVSSRIRFARAV
jgi:hypothetical protein